MAPERHNVQIEGLAGTGLDRSHESSKTTDRKENTYGQSRSNAGVCLMSMPPQQFRDFGGDFLDGVSCRAARNFIC